MSPEYAMVGHFSAKSDVFSFGVLCLEIITGRKNNSHKDQEKSRHLVGYVSTNIYMLLKSRNCIYYLTVALDISCVMDGSTANNNLETIPFQVVKSAE